MPFLGAALRIVTATCTAEAAEAIKIAPAKAAIRRKLEGPPNEERRKSEVEGDFKFITEHNESRGWLIAA